MTITNERIAELRTQFECYPAGIRLARVKEVFDALTESRAEVKELRAELATLKQGVEVPELTEDELTDAQRKNSYLGYSTGMLHGYNLARTRLVPAPPGGGVPERAAWLTVEEMTNEVEKGWATHYGMEPLSRVAAAQIARRIAKASMEKGSFPAPPPLPADKMVVDKLLLAILEESADTLADHVHTRNTFGWEHRARICVNLLDALRAQAQPTNEKGE